MQRNSEYVSKRIVVKDDSIWTKEKMCIEFPSWYMDKGMADIQESTQFFGVSAWIVGEGESRKYSVSTIPTLIVSSPISIDEVTRYDTAYTQLWFNDNDRIVDSMQVMQSSVFSGSISFNFFESYYTYGKVPWYVEYEDLVKILDNLPRYAASDVGANFIANELISGYITRAKMDKTILYHEVVGKSSVRDDYEYIGLLNPFYSAKSAVLGIAGGYFTSGLIAGIVHDHDSPTKLEEHVRK